MKKIIQTFIYIRITLQNKKRKKLIKIKIWDVCLFFKILKLIGIMVWYKNVLLCEVIKIIVKNEFI